MPKRILYILLTICATLGLASCVADDFAPDENGGRDGALAGTLTFDLSMPEASLRTRAVDTSAGSPILIGNLWIGVFDVTNGHCIGAKKYENFNQTLISGSMMKNLLSVDFVALGESLPLGYVVAVANYDGVTTHDGLSIADILPDFNERASFSWETLMNLDVDTQSAYAGRKGADDNANAPLLAGFFQDAVSLSQNPKIDQFAYEQSGPSALYPEAAAEGMDVQLGAAANGNNYVAAGAICLRRLVANNTVNINMSNGFEVTAAKYRCLNMPRSVFMLQRRTDTTQRSGFAEWQKYSPNHADHLLSEGDSDKGSDNFPYADSDWVTLDVNPWDDREHVSFTFEHFENKHWGFGNLARQEDREARNPDGTFAALCRNGESYNNYASYFVVSLHIANKATGESADIEYTLHEGFCNDADGGRAQTVEEKVRDFGSYRNVNYTYNVNIAGVEDITAYVTAEDGSDISHPYGQEGNVWKLDFATGSPKKPIPIDGGEFDYQGRGMTFSSDPDLGFRLYGYDGSGRIVDVCYNMPQGMFEGFEGIWPGGNPVTVAKTDARSLARKVKFGSAEIPQELLDGMQIGNNATGFRSIVDFIEGVENGTIKADDNFAVRFTKYDGQAAGLQGNYMRGIYVFDRNDRRNAADNDGCTTYNIAYGATQYPFEFQRVDFNPAGIYWDNTYYKAVTKLKNLFVASTPIFYGAETSVIDLRWRHDERILGYKITVFNDNYTHPTIIVPPAKLEEYLYDVKGEKVFIYPLSTANFPRSGSTAAINYNFSVTPIVDEDMYLTPETTTVMYNSGTNDTSIRVCPTIWDISSTNDWKEVLLKDLSDAEIHYRGLNVCSNKEITNYGVKGSYICYGGGGNTTLRNFYFTASVPGKIAVTCKSHSNAEDANRRLQIARMSPSGELVDGNGDRYDIVYDSKTMAGSNTTYTSDVLNLDGGKPTRFVIFALGSVDFYKFQFTPAQ